MKLAIPVAAFLVVLGMSALLNRSSFSAANGAADRLADGGPLPRNTDDLIVALQDRVRADPGEAVGYSQLGNAYLQRARETGDFGFYKRAGDAFAESLERDSENVEATVGEASLALARHDFAEGLRLGRRAQRLAPETNAPFAAIVDGQIEMGRYDAAARSLQEMVDRKPNLASYSRISYFRELHGDLRGATEAMRLAVSAGGGTAESVAYVQTLVGDLQLSAGRVSQAQRAYGEALAGEPGHLPARAGLARIDVVRGNLESAARRLRRVSERLPLPIYLTPLAEIEIVRGNSAQAERDLDLVRAQRRLLQAAGTRQDVDLVLFEADHGDPQRAVRFARSVLASAPSVRSSDALGWALTRAGQPRAGLRNAKRALRLGSVDPTFHYHAGMAARALGQRALARRELRRALSLNPSFSPFHAQRARRALADLS